MKRIARTVTLLCIAAVLVFIGCTSSPQSSAPLQQKHSSLEEYQRRLHDSPEKSPLRPVDHQYMDLNKNGKMDAYENPDLPIERRIDDLLSQMTLEEKTCQLCTLYG